MFSCYINILNTSKFKQIQKTLEFKYHIGIFFDLNKCCLQTAGEWVIRKETIAKEIYGKNKHCHYLFSRAHVGAHSTT